MPVCCAYAFFFIFGVGRAALSRKGTIAIESIKVQTSKQIQVENNNKYHLKRIQVQAL